MNEIIKVVIKGESSAFAPEEEAYKDKISITRETFKYTYLPVVESDVNTPHKMKYKTNSVLFQRLYDKITEMIPGIVNDVYPASEEVGATVFSISYSDKTKVKRRFYTSREPFRDLFQLIGEMIPKSESVPETLIVKTEEEFQ